MRPFYFRHFILRQDKAAMKAGTDSMLLGAIAPAENAQRVLDIGTGTGILSLMLAQRSIAHIDAIDIDENAFGQAKENFRNSMWRNRISAYHSSLQEFIPEHNYRYDLIVSNPPYFPAHESHKSSPASFARKYARQTSELSFHELAKHAARLLDSNGVLYLILPALTIEEFTEKAGAFGLFPGEQTCIKSKPDTAPVRVIASYSFQKAEIQASEFIIYNADGSYSKEYIQLTKSYHATTL
jgi:tRNA1Val (adenine37-N6)-methyltransferase